MVQGHFSAIFMGPRVVGSALGRHTGIHLGWQWFSTHGDHNSSGFGKMTGWWNGVATGDFNKDGKIDLIATNWGLNWRTNHQSIPIDLLWGFVRGGQTTPIEANLIEGKWKPARRLGIINCLAAHHGLSAHLKMRQVTVMDALGEEFERAKVLEAHEFRAAFLKIRPLNAIYATRKSSVSPHLGCGGGF